MNFRHAGMWALGVAMAIGAPVEAQERVRLMVVQSGTDALNTDLLDLVDKALTPALKKQKETLQEVLESFEVGIDGKRPIVVEIQFGKEGVEYFGAVPYTAPIEHRREGLFANLAGVGYKVNPVKGDPTLFEVKDPDQPKPFYLRTLTASTYATFAHAPAMIPVSAADPKLKVADLLKDGKDIVVVLEQTPEGAAERKTAMQEMRKQIEAALKFNRSETEADFALRKSTASINLAEMERFLLESQKFTAEWTTDVAAGKASGQLSLLAFDGSSLAESIAVAAAKPSYFANIPLNKEAVFYGRANFPIDSFRKEQLKAYYPTMRPVLDAKIDEREQMSAESKEASKKASGILFDMMEAGLGLDTIDSFAQLEASKGGHTLIAGIRAVDGKPAVEIIKLLPTIRADWKVKLDASEHGGVAIHEITVPESRQDEFATVFAGRPVIYIGTSEQTVWGAVGEGSLELLKAAIDAVAKPAPEQVDPIFVEAGGQFGPGARLAEKLVTKYHAANPTKDKTALAQRKERERMLKLAVDAFKPGTDRSHMELSREGTELKGKADVNEPVLIFLGSAVADFVKENLR